MSNRSRLASQPRNKLISNNERLPNASDLSPITLDIILSPNPHGKNLTNSQINSGTMNQNKTSGIHSIKI